MEYCGVTYDTSRMTLTISSAKKARWKAEVDGLLTETALRPRRLGTRLRRLQGRLAFASAVVRGGKGRTTEILIALRLPVPVA